MPEFCWHDTVQRPEYVLESDDSIYLSVGQLSCAVAFFSLVLSLEVTLKGSQGSKVSNYLLTL